MLLQASARNPQVARKSFLALSMLGISEAFLGAPRRAFGAEETLLSFDFHSDFWLNLHHRLYRHAEVLDWVQRGYPLSRERPSRYKTQGQELLADFDRLTPDQRKTWQASLQPYIAGGYTRGDLLLTIA